MRDPHERAYLLSGVLLLSSSRLHEVKKYRLSVSAAVNGICSHSTSSQTQREVASSSGRIPLSGMPGCNNNQIEVSRNRGGRGFESRSDPYSESEFFFWPFFGHPRTRKGEGGNSLIKFGARSIRQWTSNGDWKFFGVMVFVTTPRLLINCK